MKSKAKIVAMLLVALMLAMAMVGCSTSGTSGSSGNTAEDSSASPSATPEVETSDAEPSEEITDAKNTVKEKFDEETVISQLGVEEIHYQTDYSNYAVLVVKNNSEYNLDIDVNATFYGSDGNLVGAKSSEEEAIESGYETVFVFMPDEDYERMEYEFDVDETEYFECVLSDLSYEATVAKDKVILSVTNNGDDPIEFARATVLFFDGDDAVYYDYSYFVDDDDELKPGKTVNKELDCYKDFDSYRVFLFGRK